MRKWLENGLLLFFLAAVAGQDGSTPGEICPCQAEDSCQNDRHIFGRDELDIEKFGLISPCREVGEFPCCPREPPPPKEIKLTQQDLQDFSPSELAELGIMPEGPIGSSSLPLAEQSDQSNLIQQKQPPIDITQPGAASLAPHGATNFAPKAQHNQPEAVHPTHQQNPATMAQNQPVYQQRPVYQPPPVYQQRPVYQPRPVYPMRPSPRYPPPQVYRPPPMYRPPYRKY